MSKTRFNLCVAKPKFGGGVWWQKVGTMFQDGDRFSIKIDAVPVGLTQDPQGNEVPWEGWLKCFPDDNNSGGRGGSGQNSKPAKQERNLADDDDIPF